MNYGDSWITVNYGGITVTVTETKWFLSEFGFA